MSVLEAFLKRYPDGRNLPKHCESYYLAGYIDGEMFQFQIIKSLEQQIQGHVLEVLKLREELAEAKAFCEFMYGKDVQAELAKYRDIEQQNVLILVELSKTKEGLAEAKRLLKKTLSYIPHTSKSEDCFGCQLEKEVMIAIGEQK